VIVHQERVQVVDVTVRHEDVGYLEEEHSSKVNIYTPLLETLADRLKVKKGNVLPVVLGTRGNMPSSILDSLQELHKRSTDTSYDDTPRSAALY